MSFLAPALLWAAVAGLAPIVWHLRRQRSTNVISFGSLRFLEDADAPPPGRRRLDRPFLLALRVAAVIALAVAFAQPIWRSAPTSTAGGRRIAILVDASASMGREDLWQKAILAVERVLGETRPSDRVSVAVFDDVVRTLVAEDVVGSRSRRSEIAERLSAIKPGNGGTRLDHAALAAARRLAADVAGAPCCVVVVSDLQEGASTAGFRAGAWPETVSLAPIPIRCPSPTNASVHRVRGVDHLQLSETAERVRLRVANARGGSADQFSLSWATATGPVGPALSASVPPGTSRIVIAPPRPPAADRVLLTGDDHAFDNLASVPLPTVERETVIYAGAESPSDPDEPRYYLDRAFPATTRRVVRICDASALSETGAPRPALVVLGQNVDANTLDRVGQALRAGAVILAPIANVAQSSYLDRLLGAERVSCSEAPGEAAAVITDVDASHPLFAPFAASPKGDFARVRFWRRRAIALEESSTGRVVARFDDGLPAIASWTVGRGTLLAIASSWRPADSQWALSSRFVPMLTAALDLGSAWRAPDAKPETPIAESATAPLPTRFFEERGVRVLASLADAPTGKGARTIDLAGLALLTAIALLLLETWTARRESAPRTTTVAG